MQYINAKKSSKAIGTDIPLCLCRNILKRNNSRPLLKYSKVKKEYIIFCPACGYTTRPDGNKQSVIADWYMANQPGNKHIESLWIKRYLELNENRVTVATREEDK